MGVSAPPGAVTIPFTDGHLLDQDRLFSAFGLTEQCCHRASLSTAARSGAPGPSSTIVIRHHRPIHLADGAGDPESSRAALWKKLPAGDDYPPVMPSHLTTRTGKEPQ